MNMLYDIVEPFQGFLFETFILPFLHALGLSGWADEAFDTTGDILLGLLSVVLIYCLLRPMEKFWPVEKWQHRRGVRVDVLYTLLMRSGFLPLIFFLLLDPLFTYVQSQLHMANIYTTHLEDLFPKLQSQPIIAFVIYLIVFDFFDYIRHRFQHRFNWWWGLHCIHHSQTQLSLWSDERNHILDSLFKVFWFAVLAILLGVPGGQFLLIILVTKFIESLSHANARISFGRVFGKLLVSPEYHRLHHGIGMEHDGKYYGCNFATLFPIWDIIFKTSNFSNANLPTGIRDQLAGENYGKGFLEQQLIGFKRMFSAFIPGIKIVNGHN